MTMMLTGFCHHGSTTASSIVVVVDDLDVVERFVRCRRVDGRVALTLVAARHVHRPVCQGFRATRRPTATVPRHGGGRRARSREQLVPLVEVQDITVRFGGIVALDGLSFTIDEGQICGLIGPNGAGKTTMFNVVSRIYEPTSGRCDYDGRDLLARAGPRHRQPRHRPHVPEPRAVPVDDAARERDGRRPQPGHGSAFARAISRIGVAGENRRDARLRRRAARPARPRRR